MSLILPQRTAARWELHCERWWDELISVLPSEWQNRIGPQRWVIWPEIPDILRPGAVLLPPPEVLLRQIELPLVSHFNLPALMRFEAARHVPIPLDQARLDFRILKRDFIAGHMTVELAIVRFEVVSAVQALSLTSEALVIPSPAGRWISSRLLPKRNWRGWLNPRRRAWAWRMALPVGLGLALILSVQSWAQSLVDERGAEVDQARRAAMAVEPLRKQLTALNAQLLVLHEAQTRPSAASLVNEVARLLPDDAWLQEVDIEGSSIRLRGTALQATKVLQQFSDSPDFKEVRFDAPVTQAAQGQEAFDLVMIGV